MMRTAEPDLASVAWCVAFPTRVFCKALPHEDRLQTAGSLYAPALAAPCAAWFNRRTPTVKEAVLRLAFTFKAEHRRAIP